MNEIADAVFAIQKDFEACNTIDEVISKFIAYEEFVKREYQNNLARILQENK